MLKASSPAHEAQHHGHGRDDGKKHGQPHGPRALAPQDLIGTRRRRQPYQRKERVDGPGNAARRARGKEAGEHSVSRPVENVRVVEAGSQICEDSHEGQRPTGERKTSQANDGAISHSAVSGGAPGDPLASGIAAPTPA